ncbi:MAG: hypothetical protein GY722_25725 [bacterium]|nr:hypothetical protein [bacterium]
MTAYWNGISTETVWTGMAAVLTGVSMMILLVKLRDGLAAPNRRLSGAGGASPGAADRTGLRDNGAAPLPRKKREHERVFEPYTRAHDRPGMAASVGLGLTVSANPPS